LRLEIYTHLFLIQIGTLKSVLRINVLITDWLSSLINNDKHDNRKYIENKKANSVTINNNEIIKTDFVIASADYAHVEKDLIDKKYRNYSKEYWHNRSFSPSSLIFYLGINTKVKKLIHHNLFFDEDIKEFTKEIYDHKIWPKKPLFYVCCPSKTDEDVAPQGKENIFIIGKNLQTSNQQDKWAKEQLVVQLNYENDKEDNLKKDLNKVKAIFDWRELKSLRKGISKLSHQASQENIYKNFKVEVFVPSEYKILKDTSTLFWATYNPDKEEVIKQLLVFSFIPKSANLQQEVLQKTDSILAQYLKGTKQDQYVKIEYEFPPYYNNNIYKGIWKLEKGFMGGPFLAKTYFVDDKIIVSVGLVFDPNSRKRKHLKILEAIL